MTRLRLVANAGSLLLLLAGGVAAQEPQYTLRLALPSPDDSIGFPRAVHTDPHTGEVFVCDSRSGRILIFDRDSLFSYDIPGGDVFSSLIPAGRADTVKAISTGRATKTEPIRNRRTWEV